MPTGRCRVHGGASTGPRTAEGKARVVAAMVEGRRKLIERLHAEGKRAPGGRKPGVARPSERLRKLAAKKAKRRKLAAAVNRIKASASEAGEISPRARRRQITREVLSAMEREAELRRERERETHEGASKALARFALDVAITRGWIPAAAAWVADATPQNSIRVSGPTADRGAPSHAASRTLVVGRDGRYRWQYGMG
jgi:hypothetical protein